MAILEENKGAELENNQGLIYKNLIIDVKDPSYLGEVVFLEYSSILYTFMCMPTIKWSWDRNWNDSNVTRLIDLHQSHIGQ